MTDGDLDFDVPVDAGHLLQFARAIGARDVGSVAPPTYLVIADHFDPSFDRRPRWGRPWIGSSGRPSGAPDDDPAHVAAFHVAQQFRYARAVPVGEVLRARRLAPTSWTKHGRRAGRLEFVEHVTEFRDREGATVVTSTWLDVTTERAHASISTQRTPTTDVDGLEQTTAGHELVRDITRTQIAMYVGAAGDFHPLHHDDVYARHRGYPGVFVPGMLTMALTGRAVCEALGASSLASFGGRFLGQVWPGDTLRAEIHDVEIRDDGSEAGLSVVTRNQHGHMVFAGDATTHASAPDDQSEAIVS